MIHRQLRSWGSFPTYTGEIQRFDALGGRLTPTLVGDAPGQIDSHTQVAAVHPSLGEAQLTTHRFREATAQASSSSDAARCTPRMRGKGSMPELVIYGGFTPH